MRWERTYKCSFLYNEDGNELIRIIQLDNCYEITFTAFKEYERINAGSMEEAEWKAVLIMSNKCNQKANYYHKIRDHLPSIRELAERAGI